MSESPHYPLREAGLARWLACGWLADWLACGCGAVVAVGVFPDDNDGWMNGWTRDSFLYVWHVAIAGGIW